MENLTPSACRYEWSYRDEKCVEMLGVDPHTCPHVDHGRYKISDTHLRLLNGDACVNVSTIIPDTDGRGHPSGPPPHGFVSGWAAAALALLVSPCTSYCQPVAFRGGIGGELLGFEIC